MNSISQNVSMPLYNQKKTQINQIVLSEKLFRNLYILSILISSISILEPIFQFISGCLLVWAGLLLVQRVAKFNTPHPVLFRLFPLLFIGSGILTMLIHRNNHFLDNFVFLYHSSICLFLLYGLHRENTVSTIKKEMLHLFGCIVTFNSVIALIGLFIMLFFTRITLGSYTLGLMGHRFTGLYTHPNIAAFISVICLVMAHMLYNENRKTSYLLYSKKFLLVGVVANLLTIFLSDSNNAILFIVTYVVIYLGLMMIKKHKAIVIPLLKLGILGIALSATLFVSRSAVQKATAFTITTIDSAFATIEESFDNVVADIPIINNTTVNETPHDTKVPTTVGRPADREDITSGRFGSLLKGLALFEKFPIFGVGKGNILDYGKQYLNSGFEYFDLHNGYLTLLVSSGLLGFFFFTVFGVAVACRIARGVLSNYTSINSCLLMLAAAIASYCVYAFFERALLNSMTYMVAIFWLLLGYAMTFTNQSLESESQSSH